MLSTSSKFLWRWLRVAQKLAHGAAAVGLGLGLALATLLVVRGQAWAALFAPPAATVSGGRVYIYEIQSQDFPTFTVDVGVFDANKQLTTMLSAEDITHTLDGATNNLVLAEGGVVTRAHVPVAVALVLDTVASPTQFARIQAAAQHMVANLNARDELILVEARNGPPLLRELSSNKQTLQQVLTEMSTRVDTKSQVTDMRPAITQALTLLMNDRFGRSSRAVIVLSDQGGDWSGTKTITPVVQAARAISVPVHVLLYAPGALSNTLSKIVLDGATASGGAGRAMGLDEVEGALLKQVNDMRAGFRLTYVAQAASRKVGEPHPLAVMLKDDAMSEVVDTFTPARGRLLLQAPALPHVAGMAQAVMTQTLVVEVVTPTNAVTERLEGPEGLSVRYEVPEMASIVVTRPPFLAALPFTTSIRRDKTYELRTVMTDSLGNVGVVTASFYVPPTFTLSIAGVPTDAAFWLNGPHDFSFTVAANPTLTQFVYAEVTMDGGWRRALSRTIGPDGKALLTVPKESVLYGNNTVQVSAIDQYGQVVTSNAMAFSVPAVAVGLVFRVVVAALMALVLAWLLWRWWRARSYGHLAVVLRNEGNVPTDYELLPNATTPAFTFTVRHHTYPLAKRVSPNLMANNPASPPSARAAEPGQAASSAQPNTRNDIREESEQRREQGNEGGLFSKVGAWASSVGQAAGGVVSAVDNASSYVPGGMGRELRERAGVARTAQAGAERAQRTSARAENLTQNAQAMAGKTNGVTSGGTARASNQSNLRNPTGLAASDLMAMSRGEAAQSEVIAAAPKLLGRVGWWVSPVLAPGAEAEFDVVVQPQQPYQHEHCEVRMKALPTRTPDEPNPASASPDAEAPDTPENSFLQTVRLRHGAGPQVLLWLGLAAIAALAWLVFEALGGLLQ